MDTSVRSQLACPRCSSSLKRVNRRFSDRLLSMIVHVRRYRCGASACKWEGNLHDGRFALPPHTGSAHYRRVDAQ